MQRRIYLASQSPRRRELLKQIGIHFELLLMRSSPSRPADVDETPHDGEAPEDYVMRVSQAKARFGADLLHARRLPIHPVLAADTTVTLENRIYGKPQDDRHAAEMLKALSGREHQVLTAVAVALEDRVEVLVSRSTVRFAELGDERIRRYVQTHEYADKAGGYAIQGLAGAFVERLEGSYSGVMGLPLFETATLLQRFACPTP